MNTKCRILAIASAVSRYFVSVAGGICFAVWLYFVGSYLIGERKIDTPYEGVLHLFLPLFAGALFWFSLGWRSERRISFAMLCGSITLSLYMGEVLLALYHAPGGRPAERVDTWIDGASTEKKKEVAALAKQFGVEFDTRDRIEVLLDLKNRGVDAIPAIMPHELLRNRSDGSVASVLAASGSELQPLGGVSKRVTVLCNEIGDYSIFTSDEHGFNNPTGLWTSGGADVAVLGDSYVQGWCVPPDKNFVALIRESYPRTLSLGIGGNGPLLELATLKEFLPPLRPRVVVWTYFETNDLDELSKERRSRLLERYLAGDFRQGLLSRQDETDRMLMSYIEDQLAKALRRTGERAREKNHSLIRLIKLSSLRARSRLLFDQEPQEKPVDTEANLALLQTILREAKSAVGAWGGTLYFLYLPEWERYAIPGIANRQRPRVLQMAANLEIPVIDIHAAFAAQDDPLSFFPFRRAGHYNEQGNRLVANRVLKELPSRNRPAAW